MSDGREQKFHTVVHATENARSPNSVMVGGTVYVRVSWTNVVLVDEMMWW